MRLVLSDIDALNYWRRASAPGGFGSFVGQVDYVPADVAELALPKRSSHVSIDPPTPEVLDDLRCRRILGDEVAHVLVANSESRRQFRGLTCSLMSQPMPSKSLYPVYANGKVLEGIYVCSPMLALLQMADKLSLAANILLGLEACGTFRCLETRTAYSCEPLVSAREYKSFIANRKNIRGIANLRKVARWIADGSASPAEARIVTVFALSLTSGGFGLGMPLLNPTLDLNMESARLLGYHSITPDALWPHRSSPKLPGVPVEYDSGKFHNNARQLENDQRRRNAYASLGMNVVIVRPEHLCDIQKLDALAATIRRATGARAPREPKGYPGKQYALFFELFGRQADGTQIGTPENEWIMPADYYGHTQIEQYVGLSPQRQPEDIVYPDWGAS